MRYLSCFNCFAFSRFVITLLLILGGTIPDSQYILFIGVGWRHLVIARQVSLSVTSTCLKFFDLLHPGYAYVLAEKYNASPVVHIVCDCALY